MTLHSYKMVCAVNSLFVNNNVCVSCSNRRFYFGLFKRCIYNSFTKSFVMMCEMYLHHFFLNTYGKIDLYITPSYFLRKKATEMGFKQKIIVLPNIINLNDYSPQFNYKDESIVYFGRLSKEKGINILLDAIKGLDAYLKIIGDGPERNNLEEKVRREGIENVIFLGFLEKEELKKEVSGAMFSVLPSICYENYPYGIIESFALGKLVIGSDIGGIPELIKEGETGFLFKTGSAEDLKNKILQLINNKELIIRLGQNARKYIEDNHNPNRCYGSLMKEYNSILGN